MSRSPSNYIYEIQPHQDRLILDGQYWSIDTVRAALKEFGGKGPSHEPPAVLPQTVPPPDGYAYRVNSRWHPGETVIVFDRVAGDREVLEQIPYWLGSPPPASSEPPRVCNCWETISALIKPGELSGNGCDKTAERNGLILAANTLFAKRHPETKGGEHG